VIEGIAIDPDEVIFEAFRLLIDNDLNPEDLVGSEPQTHAIPRRRYDI